MSLWLTMNATPGAEIGETCREAVGIANSLNLNIEFKFNDVICMVSPGDDSESLRQSWEKSLHSKTQYKYARAERRHTTQEVK